jgi:hypothetical protein
VLRDIVDGGGDGSICAARFVDGLTNLQVEALFNQARDADYAAIQAEARSTPALEVPDLRARAARLRRRLDGVAGDDERVRAADTVWEGLYEYFRRKGDGGQRRR